MNGETIKFLQKPDDPPLSRMFRHGEIHAVEIVPDKNELHIQTRILRRDYSTQFAQQTDRERLEKALTTRGFPLSALRDTTPPQALARFVSKTFAIDGDYAEMAAEALKLRQDVRDKLASLGRRIGFAQEKSHFHLEILKATDNPVGLAQLPSHLSEPAPETAGKPIGFAQLPARTFEQAREETNNPIGFAQLPSRTYEQAYAPSDNPIGFGRAKSRLKKSKTDETPDNSGQGPIRTR